MLLLLGIRCLSSLNEDLLCERSLPSVYTRASFASLFFFFFFRFQIMKNQER